MSIPNNNFTLGYTKKELMAAIYRRLGRIMDHLGIDDELTPRDTPCGTDDFTYKNVSIRWNYYIEQQDIQSSLKDSIIRTVIEVTDNDPFKEEVFKSVIKSLNEKMEGRAKITSTCIRNQQDVNT